MQSGITRSSVVAVLLALSCAVRPAHAEPTANEIAVARQLFKDATDLEARQQWADAATKLRAAIAIKDTPGLRFHLAHAEVEQGLFVEALVDYDRADDLIRGGASAPDVADVLADARNAARQRVATLALHVQPDSSVAELTLDGKAMAQALLEQPIPLNPGTHHVEVRAASRRPFALDVQLAEGERRDLDVVLEPAQARADTTPGTVAANTSTPQSAQSTRPVGARSGNLKLAVVVGETALAAIGAAVGIGYTIARDNAVDRADRARSKLPVNACNPAVLAQHPEYGADCSTLRSSIDDANGDRSIALGGFIGAGVAGAAALATGLFWHRDARTVGGVPVDVAANVTASGFDLRIGGRF